MIKKKPDVQTRQAKMITAYVEELEKKKQKVLQFEPKSFQQKLIQQRLIDKIEAQKLMHPFAQTAYY